MNDERIDALLAAALETGEIPAEATREERAELEELLAAASSIEAGRPMLEAAARASIESARDRFGRFLDREAEADPHAGPVAMRSRPRPLRRTAAASAAIAAALVIGIGLLIVQPFGFEPDSAYAAVLDPGDYVQVEGVVQTGAESALEVRSEFGSLTVEITTDTAIVGENGASGSRPGVGRPVLVSGIVDEDGRVRASSIAVAEGTREVPRIRPFERPDGRADFFQGEVLWLSHAQDDGEGLVAVLTPDGDRLLARLDGESLGELLRRRLAGERDVRLVPTDRAGQFRVEPPGGQPPDDTDYCADESVRPLAARLCGTVIARDANSITLGTAAGETTVTVSPRTRFIAGPDSGLRAPLLSDPGSGIGHVAAIAGIARATGGPTAEVVLFGPLAAE